MCIKFGYIVLHEQNIIYLLAQVERTDKDQSDRNTAVALLQRRTIDAEKMIGRPPIGQVTQLLT